ncbi:Rossmann-like domain-containing protein [Desulfoglaeba alkanexedens]|uniref:DUF364 domain-containing protein n=1 Tax=Desulfoglaeba alkanexedens ALDC TaxID=980445 RepID=A0A4P8L5A3_9BACT|nr:DUF364 domain-containing protein [Desulfoglaeba alkanexedens]QCQ22245.1 hypothetical protein FDQ92_08780 [Desulfoglaeba alkanexedens ALDC]
MKTNCTHQDQNFLPSQRPAPSRELKLISELIESIQHPEAVISEVAVGSHFIGIRAEDNGIECVGLASTLGAAVTAEEWRLLDELPGTPLARAAELLKSASAFAISLGAAALNAGLVPPPDLPNLEASTIMAERGKHGETVLVGEFPFTDWLRKEVQTLHLFELRDIPGRTSPALWDEILSRCRVLGLTGTTLITRAMAAYLEKAPQAFTIVIGPTTPLSPVLFSHGADILAGCRVVSPGPVFEAIRQGMSFRDFKKLGVRFLAWPRPGTLA